MRGRTGPQPGFHTCGCCSGEERPSRGRSEGVHRCSNTPTHLMLRPPAGQTDMAQAEISLLAFLHLRCVCLRQLLMRINWLARLPAQPKFDAEDSQWPSSLFFILPVFPAQGCLSSTRCLLSVGAFYHPPPPLSHLRPPHLSVPSVQTCGWDTALLAFPLPSHTTQSPHLPPSKEMVHQT